MDDLLREFLTESNENLATLDVQLVKLERNPNDPELLGNSADHGLEMPAERKKAGKSEIGYVTLNAVHEVGHIIIEIADDGRGLSLARSRQKIVQNGLATEGELAAMADQRVAQFVFRAGFSTATKVTNVSGRGVGMEVVRTNVERIGGTIELKTEEGKGTTFTIKIPLTLAIVSALIVECGGERFAIPQICVLELVRAAAGSETAIERINQSPFLRLRNRLPPLISLRGLLRLGDGAESDSEKFIVVTQVGNHSFGIMVDRVFDTEEIVVKPVAPILRDVDMFSGNTILGDGSVIMILDPNGIASAIGETMGESTAAAASAAAASSSSERVALLLFRAGGTAPKAVPLALVSRLEEIDAKSIEFSNGRPVVQYRGKLMPLVGVDGSQEIKREGRQPVLVFAGRQHSMGLLVDEIVDIVEDYLNVELVADRPGVIGTAIVAGKATDVVDTGHYVTMAFADWFKAKGTGVFGDVEAAKARRILLVDDSAFFRNLLLPLLQVAGYEVTTAESANQPISLCDAGKEFAAIVSDIEMPGMNGFEFAETLRKTSRWQDTPIVAMSSHTSPKDMDRGRSVGFTDYIAKFDRDALLQTLSQTIAARGAA